MLEHDVHLPGSRPDPCSRRNLVPVFGHAYGIPWFGSGSPYHVRFRRIPATRATDVQGFTAETSSANPLP
jgi:hypothetical protein